MDIVGRIKSLRSKFDEFNIDYFLVPSNDEFFSEYVPDHLNRLKYISGFTGSNGLALIGKEINLFFTDGRYLLQATNQLSKDFIIKNLENHLQFIPNARIGYDPRLFNSSKLEYYKERKLVPCEDLLNLDKSYSLNSKTFCYPLRYAGESSEIKCARLKHYICEKNLDAIILTDSTNICWLLNIRANDVLYNPILLGCLIFYKDGRIELFSNASSNKNVISYPLESFYDKISEISQANIQIDKDTASVKLVNSLINPIIKDDPCTIWKAQKNKVEINQARRIHSIDGVALTKLLFYIERNYQNLTEIDVVKKALEFRAKHKDFICPSFGTIASFKENGAIIHYSANDLTNKIIESGGIFLLDSGGHYYGGTTDTTRTFAIGKPTAEQKKAFTLVLKGHIAIANIIFPKGTTGSQLDVLARQFLWQDKKDFAHGTGHGVGNCLSVHEGPQRISKLSNVPLLPNMIISNEPGYYKEQEFGIRIENLMIVKEYSEDFLQFETLTLVPIDPRLVNFKLLEIKEKLWLKKYNEMVFRKISKNLTVDEKYWFKKHFLIK